MDEQIKSLALQLLEQVKQGVDFVIGQLPDIANQILVYNFWNCTYWLIFFSVLAVVCIILGIICFKIGVDSSSDSSAWLVLGFIMIIVGICFSIGGCCSYIPDMIKIKTAPKLYLIEYLSKLAGLSK